MKDASCHSQRHVHNGGDTPCCRRPSGRPETFPGRPARFVHVHVTVDDTRHHHTVAHIQHLSAQTGSGCRWLADIAATMISEHLVRSRVSVHVICFFCYLLTGQISRVRLYLLDFPVLYDQHSRTQFLAQQHPAAPHCVDA